MTAPAHEKNIAIIGAGAGLRLGVASQIPAVDLPLDALLQKRREGEAPHAQGVRPPPLLNSTIVVIQPLS